MPSLMTPNNDFSFGDVTLSSPIIMSGGTHFIKYNVKGEPMYIQPPKALVKQSIIKSQKRMYCDLLFTNEHEDFLSWIENLEEHSKKYIYNQRDKWFETDLEETDIDNTFTSVLKPYKSGKYYILRVYIPVHLGNISLKIYDENENTIPIEDIKENQCVRCALDFKGIKCSPRNFQVDIELKQILLMEEEKIFETCILKKSEAKKTLEKENVKSLEKEDNLEQENTKSLEEEESVSIIETPEEEEITEEEEEISKEIPEEDDTIVLEESLEPVEFDFNSDSINDEETVSIKKPNAIYYEMYKEALKKAKMAKELALASYLEAKNIKNTYMFDDLDDSYLEEESFDDI